MELHKYMFVKQCYVELFNYHKSVVEKRLFFYVYGSVHRSL
jgi:hypothetical protein